MIRPLAVPALVLLLAACAPRTAPLPPAAIAPKFPDFVRPVPPAGLGPAAALERHETGWQWLQAGDLRAAERNFSAALKRAEAFYPAEVGLGYVALAAKKYKEALLHFDRAVVANPRYAPALAGRAEALLATGDMDGALVSLEAALQQDPTLSLLQHRIEVLRFRRQQEEITRARELATANRLPEAQAAYLALAGRSPGSAFLWRELAEVERRAGDLDAALEHAAKAISLEPEDPRAHVLLGDLHEARGELSKAIDALTTAVSLQPDTGLNERIEQLRTRAAFEAMPAEYRGIEGAAAVTRAQLAALLAVRLEDLLSSVRRVDAVVITDTRGNWAAPYILSVARAGVMEVYPNHTFQPDAVVRRGDLAQAAGNVLELIASRNPSLAQAWRDPRQKFADLGPRHLRYPAVSLAVGAGVMSIGQDGHFNLADAISGAEALAAVAKLEELGRE